MLSEDNLSTSEKALLRDRESRKALGVAATKGDKLRLLPHRSLTCLFYLGTKPQLLLFIHGGGFCFKSPLDDDEYCSYLRDAYGFSVLNLDFSTSAKKSYPAQLLELRKEYRRFLALETGLANAPLYLFGLSSGANLATALTLMLRQETIPVSGLFLGYPYLDLTRDPNTRPVFPETFPDWLLKDWTELYCPFPEVRANPLVSPLKMSSAEATLFPKTYVITSETDRLRDDGVAFETLLTRNGVEAFHFQVQERHGFLERNMKNVYTKPDDPGVLFAKKITRQAFTWLLDVDK
jgi:Esterase/lipase